jgi:hypothetical protein
MPKGVWLNFDTNTVTQIISDYEDGMSTQKLGAKYICDPKRISRLLKKNKIEVLARPFKLNTNKLDNFINDYKSGKTYSQLEEIYGLERECVATTLNRCNIERRPNIKIRESNVNDNYFETIDTEEKAYWLGFITTDGCVTKGHTNRVNTLTIHLANKDREHLEKFKKCIETDYEIKFNTYNNSVYLNIVSEKIVKDLAKYGVVQRKTGKCYYPDGLIPDHLVRHYWRGCIDGDGCISYLWNNPVISFYADYSLNLSFKNFCQNYLKEELQNYIFIRDPRTITNFWRFSVFEKQALSLMHYLYENSKIYLQRKMIRYIDLYYNNTFVKYKNNEKYYNQNVKGFLLKSIQLST